MEFNNRNNPQSPGQPKQRKWKPTQGVDHGSMKKYSQWVPGQDEIMLIIYQLLDEYLQTFPSRQTKEGVFTFEQFVVAHQVGLTEDQGVFISSIKDPVIPNKMNQFYTAPERKSSPNSSGRVQQLKDLDSPGKDFVWSLGACLFYMIVGIEAEDISKAVANQTLDVEDLVQKMIKKSGTRSMDHLWPENLGLLKLMLNTNRQTRPDVQAVFNEVEELISIWKRGTRNSCFHKEPYLFNPLSDSRNTATHVSAPLDNPKDVPASIAQSQKSQETQAPLQRSSFQQIVLECKLMMEVCSLLHNVWCYFRSKPLQNTIAAASTRLTSLINRLEAANEWKDPAENLTRFRIANIKSELGKFDIHLKLQDSRPIFYSYIKLLTDVYSEFPHIFENRFYLDHLPSSFVQSEKFEQEMQQLAKKTAQACMILALLGKEHFGDGELSSADPLKIIGKIIGDPMQLMKEKQGVLESLLQIAQQPFF